MARQAGLLRRGGSGRSAEGRMSVVRALPTLVAGALMLLTAQPALAWSGIDLAKYCNEPPPTIKNSICASYIHGVIDGMFIADIRSAMGHRWCPPEATVPGIEQSVIIVRKYLNDHPEKLNDAAGMLAAVALYSAFPCK
jgi:hypothetical protein